MSEHRGSMTRWVIVAVLVATLLVGGRYLWLMMMAAEGDVPPVSAVPLPAGAEIVSEQRDCASGGCWVEVTVRPAPGTSPQELAEEIGATPQLEIPGNLVDPRTIWVWAEPGGGLLTLQVDYFSQKWVAGTARHLVRPGRLVNFSTAGVGDRAGRWPSSEVYVPSVGGVGHMVAAFAGPASRPSARSHSMRRRPQYIE